MDTFTALDARLMLTPLFLTFKTAGTATLLSFTFGTGIALFMARKPFPGRDWLDAICALPLVMPPTVLGYYILVLVGRNGIFGKFLQANFGFSLVFTWQGAALAASVTAFPLVYKSARAAFEGVDSRLENAARTLGAGEAEVFLRVTLPLAWRGILAGTMLAFARAMGEFGATLMVAGNLPGKTQTMSLAVYDAVQAGEDDRAMFLVAVMSLVCILVLVFSEKTFKTRR